MVNTDDLTQSASTHLNAAADTTRERASHVKALTESAAKSRAYFYPPLGTVYLLRHASLWPPVLRRLPHTLLLATVVVTAMFLFTYLPQAAILTALNGPVGPFSALALVLSESATIVNWVTRNWLLQDVLVDVFDATLVCEGLQGLVEKGREVKQGKNSDGAKKLGKLLTKPMEKLTLASLVEYAIFLPINLIPFVGTPVFLILQGRKTGPGWHSRYFQLKNFDGAERDQWVSDHKGGYIAFGVTSLVMNLIPLASILFTFTSTVGAALWAAEIEKNAQHPGEMIDIDGSDTKHQEL